MRSRQISVIAPAPIRPSISCLLVGAFSVPRITIASRGAVGWIRSMSGSRRPTATAAMVSIVGLP